MNIGNMIVAIVNTTFSIMYVTLAVTPVIFGLTKMSTLAVQILFPFAAFFLGFFVSWSPWTRKMAVLVLIVSIYGVCIRYVIMSMLCPCLSASHYFMFCASQV